MTYSRGLQPDDGRVPRSDFALLRAGLASETPRGLADLDAFLPPAIDQNLVGSCAPSALLVGAVGTLAAAGDPLGILPSVATAYPMCLALDRAARYPKVSAADLEAHYPLVDRGTSLLTVVEVVSGWGVVPMGPRVVVNGVVVNSDCGPDNATAKVVLDTVEQAATRLIVGAFEMLSVATLLRDLKLALDHGIFVAQGGWVCRPFEEYRVGSAPLGAQTEDGGGGHATLLTGYRESPAGTIWRGRNSWDPNRWGLDGRSNFEATDDFVLSRWTSVCLTVRKA